LALPSSIASVVSRPEAGELLEIRFGAIDRKSRDDALHFVMVSKRTKDNILSCEILIEVVNVLSISDIEEIQALCLGLDLLVLGHPHWVTTLKLNEPQLIQVEVVSGVVGVVFRVELAQLNLVATIQVLGRIERNGKSQIGEGKTSKYPLHHG